MICRLCKKNTSEVLIDFGNHPISRHLLDVPFDTLELYPVILCECTSCGFISLKDHIDGEILYKNGFNKSAVKKEPHLGAVINIIMALVESTTHSTILEIGCNDGTLLKYLSEIGYKNLTGIDPSAEPNFDPEIVADYFDLESARNFGKQDVIIARHVLEHIYDLENFGLALQAISKVGTQILIEVPNFSYALVSNDYSHIWEEHTNYFTFYTLHKFLKNLGFEPEGVHSFDFCGESILITGRYTGEKEEYDSNQYLTKEFVKQFPIKKEQWKKAIQALTGKKIVYGIGCRTAAMLNFLDLINEVDLLVDDQKEKQYKYFPSKDKRLMIEPAISIHRDEISNCLLGVNEENEAEILRQHADYDGRFYSLFPSEGELISANYS